MQEPGKAPAKGLRSFGWQPWAVLLVGLLLTLARWDGLRREDQRRLEVLQGALADAITDRLERRTREVGHILAGAASFMAREPLPSRAEWRDYAESLGVIHTHQGVQGLSFAQWIPRAALPAHLERIRREGFPDYQVLPGGDLPADPEGLSSIVLLEPMDARNQRAFGRDMWADPVRREAMARARDTGHPALSGRLRLYQEGESDVQAGLVLYAPVFRRNLPLDSIAHRRAALLGWATCVLRMGDFMDALLRDEHARMDIDLFDGAAAEDRRRLYDTDPGLALGKGGSLFERRLDVAGRTWTLQVRQNPDLAPGGAPQSRWEILFGGLVITGLMATLFALTTGAERRALRLADQRGAELRAQEARFEALFQVAPLGMTVVDSATSRFIEVNPRFAELVGCRPEELIGRTFQSITPPDQLAEDLQAVDRLESGALPLVDREKRYLHKLGHQVWGRLRLVKMPAGPDQSKRRLALVEDITELRQATAAHEASATFAQSVLDAMPANVAVLDASGRVVKVNRSWEDFAAANGGPAPGSWAGTSYLDAIPAGPDFQEQTDGIQAVIAGRRPDYQREYECDAPDLPRWFQMMVTAIPGHAGCLVAHLDITKVKQAEAATRTSEALFRGLFELSPDPITLSDLETGHLLQVNPAWCELLGIAREQALGRTSGELGSWVQPEDRQTMVDELRVSGRVGPRSATLRRVDGEQRPMMFTARVLDLQERRCVLVMAKDLTGFQQAQEALRASEARFRLLADNARDVVFRYRYLPEPGFEYVSPSITTLTGYTPEELYQDPSLGVKLFHPEEPVRLEQVLASPETVLSTKFRWIRKDGTLLWTDQLLSLERDDSGRVVALQGAVRDVTAEEGVREQLEEQLQRYASVMETSLDALHVIDREGRLRYWNPAFLAHLGYDAGEAGRLGVTDWDRQWNAVECREMIDSLMRRPRRIETIHRRKDGTLLHVEINASRIVIGGEALLLAAARDVTEKVKAEVALSRSEARYRLLADNAKDIVFRYRLQPDHGWEIVSPAAGHLTGYSIEEHVADPDLAIRQVLPEDRDRVREAFLAPEGANQLRYRLRRKDGGLQWLELTTTPFLDAAGQVTHIHGIARDVNDQVAAETALRRSETRFRTLFKLLPVGVTLTDPEGQIIHTNPASEGLLGIPSNDLVRREFRGPYWEILRPDGSPMPPEEYASVRALDELRRIENVEMGVRRPDGGVSWITVSAEPVIDADLGVIIVYSDITARKLAEDALREREATLRSLSDNLPDSYMYQFRLAPDGAHQLLHVSAGVERLCGVPAEAAVAEPGRLLGLLDPDMAPAYFAAMSESARDLSLFNQNIRQRGADGEWHWFHICSRPRRWADGSVVWDGIARDITGQVEAAQALRESENRFRHMADQAPVLMWIAGPDKLCTWFNHTWLEFTGRSLDQELGNGWAEGVHPEDLQRRMEIYSRRFDAREPFGMEYRLRHHSGDYRWLSDRGTPRHAEDGRFLGYIGACSDIDDEKQAEAELLRSESRLRLLSDQLPDSFIYQYGIDPERGPRFRYLSAGVERLCGIRPEDALRDPGLLLGQIDPAMLPAYLEAEAASAAARSPFAMELRIQRRDGQWRWFRMRAMPRQQEDGSITWEGISTDITEEVENQHALAETEARWKFALEGSGQGVWDWIAATNEVYFSPQWKAMLGYAEDEIGNGLAEWDSRLHPEDRDATYRHLQAYLDGAAPFYSSEHRLRCKDGSYRWVHDRGIAVERSADGRPARLIGVHIDITDRKRSEEVEARFRQVVDQAADAIFVIDEEGRFLLCNEEACRSTGYRREELLAMRVADLDPSYSDDRHGVTWRNLESGTRLNVGAIHRRKDGSTFPVEIHLGLLESEGPRRILAFVRDLSERERAQAADLRAQKAESLVLMAGSIAHDFNNLFQALLASVDLAELKAKGDSAVVEPLRSGREVLRRAIGLSWKMLDFSGRAIARLEPADLGLLLGRWQPDFERLLGGPRLDLAVAEGPLVQIDVAKVRSILEALLVNAREAMDGAGRPLGRVRLALAVDYHEDRPERATSGLWIAEPPSGPATVLLELADDGPGAAPHVLARMFDPFFTTKELGRGLGLPSALGLLQAHRAGVHVLLGETGGLVFRLHFPLPGF